MDEIEGGVLDFQNEIKRLKVRTKKDLSIFSERMSKVEGKNTKKTGKVARKKKQLMNE